MNEPIFCPHCHEKTGHDHSEFDSGVSFVICGNCGEQVRDSRKAPGDRLEPPTFPD